MTKGKFQPRPEQMALYPAVSGNTINGLGETERRRPSYVYWGNDPEDVAHGAVQRWFYTVDPGLAGYGQERQRRAAILDAPLVPLADKPEQIKPEDFATFSHQGLDGGDFDKIGVAPFDHEWAFEGVEIAFERVVMLGFHHDFEEISKAPAPEGGLEVMRQYRRAAHGAKAVANWLRTKGWDAEPLTGPMSGKIAMIPAALACGFGELGKHGSVITPEFGSSFRLSAVLTDCPLPLSAPVDHGIDDFCMNCRVCEDACPPKAIGPEKQRVRGELKWYVDFDKCLPFFNEHQGCAVCLAVCPWSRPGVGPRLADKLERRRTRKTLAGEG
ncbi:MAG: (Fe-S)-binding protein [Kiloniella sp.]|nr:(Fe-S)-binding protein [Kiloniella sp.]